MVFAFISLTLKLISLNLQGKNFRNLMLIKNYEYCLKRQRILFLSLSRIIGNC